MKNLLIFTYGKSVNQWFEKGILERELLLYKELEKIGVKFRFLTFGNDEDFKYQDILNTIKIIPVQELIKSRIPKFHFIKSLFLPFKLKKEFQSFSLIKTNQIRGSLIACVAKIFYKKKIIVRGGYEWLNRHIILSKKKGLKSYIKYFFSYCWISINELIVYKLADGIILTNNQDIEFITRIFNLKRKFKKKQIEHIYNFVDVDLFKPLNIVKKDKHILFIGRLTTQKNLMNLLMAFKNLKGFYLDIIGWGGLKEKLKKYAQEMNININFLGVLPNNKLPEKINQYEIFILPSYWEGNPKVLLEAMSCGSACIGSDIPSINNIIKHKYNGYLCDFTPESISKAILNLYHDKKLKEFIGENARKFILRNCELKTIAEKEYLFYKKILSR